MLVFKFSHFYACQRKCNRFNWSLRRTMLRTTLNTKISFYNYIMWCRWKKLSEYTCFQFLLFFYILKNEAKIYSAESAFGYVKNVFSTFEIFRQWYDKSKIKLRLECDTNYFDRIALYLHECCQNNWFLGSFQIDNNIGKIIDKNIFAFCHWDCDNNGNSLKNCSYFFVWWMMRLHFTGKTINVINILSHKIGKNPIILSTVLYMVADYQKLWSLPRLCISIYIFLIESSLNGYIFYSVPVQPSLFRYFIKFILRWLIPPPRL